MFTQIKNKWPILRISVVLQLVLNTALILLAIILSVLLLKEIVYFISVSFSNSGMDIHYKLLERIMVFFLYFEFIAMIIKYFQEQYHFPIRYFLYIGITAMIRLIIVYHENPVHTLLFSLAILVLIISFYIMNSATGRRGRY
ncbi:phosphate-starvation-inducible protein PsiE [Bacillus sp. V5-8f]|uniref:phosphate-starvation-inducible protein PsiE n=1 Tax=Bacillus sp. V5-8f TaxID=2053044 RepID=UPI000C75B1D4|nr:phosphate-starvation-inducible protein PsiE [Bacillus sp. V5-8f]PLT35460.1 phosphate-starvation-inducible protein PsiE [Bacillus sp. V5-8f]